MAILINDNYNLTAPKPFDARYYSAVGTPWVSVGAANAGISSFFRYQGLTINILGVEYWYGAGILDTDLVVKSNAGTLTGATGGLHLINGGTSVMLGGTLSGTTLIIDPDGRGIQYGGNYLATFLPNSLITKQYADAVAVGVHPKMALKVATTGNTAPFPPTGLAQTIDGINTFISGDRILFKDQTNKTENGIYSASTGTWGRTNDFDATSGETVQGDLVPVITGATNRNTLWVLVEPKQYTGFTQNVEFTLFGTVTLTEGTGISILGSTVSISLPYQVQIFASLTGTTGTYIGTNGRNVCFTGAADAILANALTGATNGLNYVNRCVYLGGALCQNTNINSGANTLAIGTTGEQIRIDSSAIVIGNTGLTNNYIYTSPTATDICAGGELNLMSSKVCVCGTDMQYDTHPSFTTDTQIVDKKYVDDKVYGTSGSTLYSGASPSTITVGWMTANTVLTGKTISKILETILVKYIAPSFSTFSVNVSSPVEVGCTISGSKSFSFGFNQPANVAPNTLSLCNVSLGTTIVTGCPTSSPQTCTIASRTFASCGETQLWCARATDICSNSFGSGTYTVTSLLPYYWGLCTCPGPAGANRPVATCAMVLTGTKILAGSSSSISIAFNSTGDDYLWFAVPTEAGADKTTWYINPSNCGLIGGGIGAGCNLFPAPDPVAVTTVCWSGCPYKVYISNKQAIASGAMLIG